MCFLQKFSGPILGGKKLPNNRLIFSPHPPLARPSDCDPLVRWIMVARAPWDHLPLASGDSRQRWPHVRGNNVAETEINRSIPSTNLAPTPSFSRLQSPRSRLSPHDALTLPPFNLLLKSSTAQAQAMADGGVNLLPKSSNALPPTMVLICFLNHPWAKLQQWWMAVSICFLDYP